MDEGTPSTEDAVTCFFPLYEMARMRAATARRRLAPTKVSNQRTSEESGDSPLRWCNVFFHSRQLLGAGNSRVVTPNNDTLYSSAWLDLRRGPQILEVPETDGRYYVLGLQDMYTNPFATIGTRTMGTHPRSFLLTPPGWSETIPEAWQAPGAHIPCTTHWVWIIGRILLDNAEELPAVHQLQDGIKLRGLHGEGPSQFDPAFDPEFLGQLPPSARQLLQVVNRAMAENPPPASQQAHVARFAALGFDGQSTQPSPQNEALIEQAIANCLARWRDTDIGQRSASGWQSMPLLGPSFGDDHTRRAIVALKYIGALDSQEACYPMAFHDASGQTLSGAHHYRLRFEANALPPVHSFWSVTMYSTEDRMLVPNELNRFAIGDRTPGLHWAADGSLTIEISHRPPSDPQALANWLPAPPGDFYLCLRAYIPKPAMLDGSYQLPPLVRQD